MTETINSAVKMITARLSDKPEIAIILGTGLGSLVDNIEDAVSIPYTEIPGFPLSTAPSHKGRLLFGYYGKKYVMVMQGRIHYYEGYDMQQVTYPVRIISRLGIKTLIVTNVSGSLRKEMQPGSIVLIDDHINFMGTNPLIGQNDETFGERFPSMNDNYSSSLRGKALTIAEEQGIELFNGVYIGVSGPSLETRSECRAFAQWGADIVGMSTVPEVIVAVHCGISVLGLSVVSNMSNLFHKDSHQQEAIRDIAALTYPKLRLLIENLIEQI